MCLSNSQDADSMSMCQSNSQHCDAVMGGVHRVKVLLPNEDWWKAEQKMKCEFRMKHFSMVSCPNLVLQQLNSLESTKKLRDFATT